MKKRFAVLLIAVVLTSATALAVPGLITYQGRLTNPEGQPITGSVTITFTFWSAQSGGTQLGSGFSDADTVTPDAEGIYSTLIGDDPSPAVPSAIFESNTVWLNVNVNGENLTPRKRVSSVAYAVQSANADTLDGSHKESFANATHTHNAFDIDSGTFAPYLIPDSLTLTSSSFIHGEAIRTGTVSQAYIDQAIARDNEIMPAVLANDGSGSTLDADTLDGQQSTAFASTEHTHTGYAASSHQHSGADITSGTVPEGSIPSTIARDNEILSQVLAGDGSGSGLDADKIDGKDSSQFLTETDNIVAIDAFFQITSFGTTIDAETSNAYNFAVYGKNTSTDIATGAGGYFNSSCKQGRGVIANASATGSYINYGGYFSANGNSGVGVYGEAGATGSVTNMGGKFVAYGNSGRGVHGDGGAYDFYAAGPGANYGPFTGAHEVRLAGDFPAEITPGMVVCTTGLSLKRTDAKGDTSISSTLPTVRLADTPQDKTVFGVMVKEMPLGEDHWYKAAKGERFAAVNALGDGRVWVCTANGEIAMGDYLTTSSVPGYAQKQNDDLQHNYTVGKVTESVDWSAVTDTLEFGGQTYKVYLIAVVYTCG